MRRGTNQRLRQVIAVLLAIGLCLVTGCADTSKQTEEREPSKPERYMESSEVYRYSQEYCPLYLAGAGETGFYFYRRTDWEEDGHAHWTTAFFRQDYSGDSEPESIPVSFENPFHTAISVSAGEDGEDLLNFLMMEETDQGRAYRILVYTGDGILREEVALSDKALSDAAVIGLLPLGEEGFGILSRGKLFISDRTGNTRAVFPCPEGSFQGMTRISGEELAVTYYDEGTGSASLSTVDWKKEQMSKGILIKGDGQLLACEGGRIRFLDTDAIYEMNLETKEVREMILLKGRNILPDRTVDMKAGDGSTALLCYGTDNNVAKYVVFSPDEGSGGEDAQQTDPEKYDFYERRLINLYIYSAGTWKETELGRIIDAFNEQSDSYQVVLKDYGYQKSYEEGFDPLKVLASKDFPDLIFSDRNSLMSILTEKDCFEDLTPYIENSDIISLSDITVPVLNAYSDQGRIYALPRDFQLSAILGKKSQMGEPGWTVEEFLSWIGAHPDLDSRMNLTRDAIYDMCIEAVLGACIDLENGEADFTGEAFRSFAVGLKDLNRSNEVQKPNFDKLVDSDSWIIQEAGIERLSRAALAEMEYGEECVFKGYPGKDGEPVYYFDAATLSIFHTSDVKQGAYEFLEYYLTYQGEDFIQGAAPLYTLKGQLEKGIELTLQYEMNMQEGFSYAATREQIDKILALFPYAVPKKEKYGEVRTIVDEELQPFLEGQKDIDTVCEVIQSRVRIYLEENK